MADLYSDDDDVAAKACCLNYEVRGRHLGKCWLHDSAPCETCREHQEKGIMSFHLRQVRRRREREGQPVPAVEDTAGVDK